MRRIMRNAATLTLLALGIIASLLPGCSDEHADQSLNASTLELRVAPDGDLDRPAATFDHGQHTDAFKTEGCKACHPPATDGRRFELVAIDAGMSRSQAMDAYHAACMKCHTDRARGSKATGPLTCGACHSVKGTPPFARVDPRFDYSLHDRHSKAPGHECKTCHHAYDENAKKLVYREHTESACRDCHGAKDEGRHLSIRNASHEACVGCHATMADKGEKTGPTLCAGCHDAAAFAAIARQSKVPRMDRDQPDLVWVRADGGKAQRVPFDHKAHEPLTTNCSSCHHKTLRACSECHTVDGKAEGGNVTLERASHHAESEHSCVGCHRANTKRKECAGCHHALEQVPAQSACQTCHSGPGAEVPKDALPAPSLASVELAALPATSDAYPNEVTLDSLAADYGATKLPHARIVAAIDRDTRNDPLARRFHGRVETLCAGCHHHSPVGVKPPACRSCHSEEGGDREDRPGLKAAYHRQCITCHERMEIKAVGCTDCHAKASKEVAQ